MNTLAKDLFVQAHEMETAGRDAFLAEACGDNAELRLEVQRMLVEAERANSFFAGDDGATLGAEEFNETYAEKEGDMIGNYKLLQKIGEGGFGVVYMADQLQPVKRRVALKIIKLGMDTRQVVARFEVERQALAMMDHSNIAKVLDAGATETGRPYFVMELVRGIPITTFCDEQNLSTEERLELFIDVCKAVQHAHQKGIIHRDLKPSNVMVTMHDDKAIPKVIDFGVAKATQTDLTDMTLYTRYEQFIGTPAYMSPEQAQMSGLDIDTRSDIYALGVLLYELLTGRTPFDSKDLLEAGQDEIRRVIREDEPPKPSTRVNTLEDQELTDLAKCRNSTPNRLHTLLRGDLDWIIMMALEKDRTRRYETANGLAMDIRRHLENEPVIAAAPNAFYRLSKYARRHRRSLMVASALAIILLAAGTIIVWQAIETSNTRGALKTAEFERQALEMEKRAKEIRREQRGLTQSAIAVGEWEVARSYVREFLRNPQDESHRTIKEFNTTSVRSMDRIKLAALNLAMGDLESHEKQCLQMIEELDRADLDQAAERTVRAFFAVPRSPDDPRAQDILAVSRKLVMPDGYAHWEVTCRGIAEFRMGNYEEARTALSDAIQTKSLKLQVTVRPYLAMTCHDLGDAAEARRYLEGAEAVLTELEASDVNYFWHERILGRLALEEARELIGEE